MHRKKALIAFGTAIVLASTGLALAHPGRTNSSGCHNNRRTGGYHCHNGGGYSGGWSAPAEPTRIQVVSIPRARVWVNGTFLGMSPTKAVTVDGTSVKVRLEHNALGSHEAAATIGYGETTELTVRW